MIRSGHGKRRGDERLSARLRAGRRAARGLALLTLLAGLGTGCARPDRPPARILVPSLGRLPAFSHASVAGDLIFVSGTLGTREGSVELVAGGVASETEQALRNLEAILAASRATLRDVAKCNVYLVDLADFAAMSEVWLRFFAPEPPARTTVGVAQLVLGARVELECVAQRPRTG